MKKILIGLFFWVLAIPFWGQTQHDNLVKYWKFRERLRNRFIVVSENVMDYGVNIPASDIFYNPDSTKSSISWGDGNNNMSHYLSMLATELWLLKQNNQDYSSTLKELYYAMLALERLDTYSESNLRWKEKHGSWVDNWQAKTFVRPGDINGFSLRNDVTEGFWSKYGSHFDVANFESNFKTDPTYFMEENSQDVIEHTMEGLGLVSKLVGTESVEHISCNFSDIYIKPRLTRLGIMMCGSDFYLSPQTINFSLWAKDFVKRFIRYMQYDGTYRGKIGGIIPFKTHWILVNPVTNKCVLQGSGTDGGVAMISNGLIKTGEEITGENLRIYPGLFTDAEFKLAFKNPKVWQLGKEDNKTRSLAVSGNILGTKTFNVIRNLRDNYNPHKTGHFPIYEHFPLIYLAMHNSDYDFMGLNNEVYHSEKALYQNLLNSAPINGPASNCGVWDWTSTSRCLWPENLGQNSDKHIEYNGLDYMMLHNLYYIAFREDGFKNIKN
jgi:hypothetical protein